jgi:hypothetical protein
MRRLTLFLFLAGFHLTIGYAQLTPEFETTFFFEDAVGNRDSIVIGYHEEATSCPEPLFGEEVLTSPFDSVFEVRAAPFVMPIPCEGNLSKRVIFYTNYNIVQECALMSTVIFYVQAQHWPVQVSWDSVAFSTERCRSGSAILNHIFEELAGPIDPDEIPPIFECLSVTSSAYFDLSPSAVMDIGSPVSIDKPVEGQGIQSIYGLRFHGEPEGGYTPCYWVTTPVEGMEDSPAIQVFPNPASTSIQVSGLDANFWEDLWVVDLQGRRLHQVSVPQGTVKVDVIGWPSGIYFLQLTGRNGQKRVEQIVVAH